MFEEALAVLPRAWGCQRDPGRRARGGGARRPLTSPAYDLGATEQEVRERWERHYGALCWGESGAPTGA